MDASTPLPGADDAREGAAGAAAAAAALPPWAGELVTLYESGAANQFILHGNVHDRRVLHVGDRAALGSLEDFLLRVLMSRFDVILTYDLGNGLRVEKGKEIFADWPAVKELSQMPKAPRAAIELITVFFRYAANMSRLGRGRHHLGCIVRAAHLVAPAAGPGAHSYDLSALAVLIRDWSSDTALVEQAMATFLIVENLSDLHGLLVNNSRAAQVKIPLPTPEELARAIDAVAPAYPDALREFGDRTHQLAGQLAGATCAAVESMLKTKQHRRQPITDADLVQLKKQLVERDCNGLIEFLEPRRTLDDVHGMEPIKAWLRQDFALWKQNDLAAMPMGYLLCGPVGTGKTYLAECLAGEAGVPVVRLKNFRDKWVGSTESNLEKIFRLLQALGRCFVFIDEADQALGRREAGANDSGVSGRVYSMMAEEMSNTRNRGRVVWLLASSRPDLIEVDLKRPGRIDVKIPLLPTSTPAEGFALIRALCKRRGVELADADFFANEARIPTLLTPGAAENLAVKIYRTVRTRGCDAGTALADSLVDYRPPVPREVLEAQILLAVREASDVTFIPPAFRDTSPA